MLEKKRNLPGRALFATISLIMLFGLVTGCADSNTQESGNSVASSLTPSPLVKPTNGLVQTSDAGGVTINIEWRGLKDGSLVFSVVMDTHSGSLDQYDLKTLFTLRDSFGNEYRPGSADVTPGGHHRNGLLTFDVPDSINPLAAKYFELILRNIAGVPERDLRWQLN